MRILIELGHPSHYLLFRNTIKELHRKGDKTLITVRDREGIVSKLIEADGLAYVLIGKDVKPGISRKALQMVFNDIRILRLAHEFRPDVFLSMGSPYAGHIGCLMRKPHISFDDTEVSKIAMFSSLPFSTVTITPSSFRDEYNIRNHIRVDAYKPFAYLHPKYFKPDQTVLAEAGVNKNDKFVIVRFSSYDASHDIGKKGLDGNSRKKLLDELSKLAKVFVTSEIDIGEDLRKKYLCPISPDRMHDLLSFAALYVGEGSTMATEAAILGVPAVFIHRNSAGILDDLESKGLLAQFHDPNAEIDKIIDYCRNAMTDEGIRRRHLAIAANLLESKDADLTSVILREIDKYRKC